MSSPQKMYRCRNCGRPTVHLVQGPRHAVHFILTLLTAGIWLLPWLGFSLVSGAPRCTNCGTKRRAFGL